ncbi:MAG: TetR family transcriptional regulator [Candidatus Bipolaricaulota bacterium]
MSTLRKTTAERKEEVVEASLDLIARLGIRGLTTARLAERVELSEAALYRHFSSKVDIVRATIETVGQQLMETLVDSAANGTPSERLHRALEAQLVFIERRPAMPRILFSDEIHFNEDTLREQLYGVITEYKDYIVSLLSEGVAVGEFRDDLDVNAAAQAFLGLVQAQVLVWSLSEGQSVPRERVHQLWDTYWRGIR